MLTTGVVASASQITLDELNSSFPLISREVPMLGISGVVMGLIGFGWSSFPYLKTPYYTTTGYVHARRLAKVLYAVKGVGIKLTAGVFLFGAFINQLLPNGPVAQTAHLAGFVSGVGLGAGFLLGGVPGLLASSALQLGASYFALKNPSFVYRYNAWSAVQEFAAGNWANAERYLRQLVARSQEEDKWAVALLALTLSQIPERRDEAKTLFETINIQRDLPTKATLEELKKQGKNLPKQFLKVKQ